MISVIIVAAGKSERFKGNVKKQFLEINGKPLFLYAIEPFLRVGTINEIILIVPDKDISYAKSLVNKHIPNSGIEKIIGGGERRQDSVYNGLKILSSDVRYVLIHDGARPFITAGEINKIIKEVKKYEAVIPAVPVRDTLIKGKNKYIDKFISRDNAWQVQTPQAFRADLIMNAHEWAFRKKFYGTDDSALLEKLGIKVKIVSGNYSNIKITTIEDLQLAWLLLKTI